MGPPALERRLAAILSADAVGYSRLMADDQAATVHLITSYRDTFANLVNEHRGRVVDAPGDNVLAEFPTALDAVESAIEIQRVLHARNLSLPEDRRMRFRIGVHLGDITTEGGRVYGDGVNVAARIESLAEPGGICISGTVQEQLRQRRDLAFKDMGDKTLKNIPAPVRVFGVRFDGQAKAPKPPARPESGRRPLLRTLLPWALTVVLGGALAYSFDRSAPATAPQPAISRFQVTLPPDSRLGLAYRGGMFDYSRLIAISPDGSQIVYTVQDEQRRSQLYVRRMDTIDARPIPGTANGRAPFFSPDGQWVGFLANNTLNKIALTGGSPQPITSVDRVVSFDATWSPDGASIVYATDDGLWQVSALGGTAQQLTKPDPQRGEVGHHSPRMDANGQDVLFTVSITPETHLARFSLDTGEWEIILRNASQGVPLGAGRIVFARAGELLITSYETESGQLTGSASLLQGVHTSPGLGGVVLSHFDISETGTLAYVPATAMAAADSLLWVDHDGNESVITSGPGTWVHPRLSPDGQRISLDIHSSEGMRDVYIYEIERAQTRQLTRSGITWESEWRPDGKELAIMSGAPAGRWSLFTVPVDFSKAPELIFRANHAVPACWLSDDQSLLFHDLVDGGIWKVSTVPGAEPEIVLHTEAEERFPSLSRDGNWIAYVADESGRGEVFVQSFPDLGPQHRISIEGGGEPRWSRDGRHLFFRRQGQMLVADVELEPMFRASRPRVLFSGDQDFAASGHQHYDISSDSKRFLMIKRGESTGPSNIQIVLNWENELDRR